MGIPTTPSSGFRDFLPQTCAARARAVESISRVYRSFGFSQIQTSAVEDLAVLLGKGGGENEKLIFKILKRGEKLAEAKASGELADMGLRFDLTLPLARYYSRFKGELPNPFKAFHIGPVWRAERAQKGRYREFYQCDADIIGSESPYCEVEVIQAINAAFAALGLEEPTTVISDRSLLFALFDQIKIPADKRGETAILLDKLDKVERQTVLAELETALGSSSAKALETAVLAPEPDLDRLSTAAPEAVKRLLAMLKILRDSTGKTEAFKLLPSLVRGFDYYTGPVFEFRHPKLSGSLGGGGRYDRLTEKFGGQSVPACGGSIGFERLMLILEENGQGPKAEGPQVCVTIFSEDLRGQSLQVASRLRKEGLSVDVYPGTGKLKAQFKYADSKKALFALVIGPEEASANQVKAKDMRSGEEKLMSLEALAASLLAHRPHQQV